MTVIPIASHPRFRRVAEPTIGKAQLAMSVGYTTRWVELRVREGMPSELIGGRRRFRLSEVQAWLGCVRIPLRGRDGTVRDHALVDRVDAPRVEARRWCLGPSGYAVRMGADRLLLMHREILKLPGANGVEVDHINGNRLDNRRENLRKVTRAQNAQNLRHHHGASRFRGVVRNRRGDRWVARLNVAGTLRWGGTFDDEVEAARAAERLRSEHMPYAEPDPALVELDGVA